MQAKGKGEIQEGKACLDVLQDVRDAKLLLSLGMHVVSITNLSEVRKMQKSKPMRDVVTWKVFWQNLMAAIFCC